MRGGWGIKFRDSFCHPSHFIGTLHAIITNVDGHCVVHKPGWRSGHLRRFAQRYTVLLPTVRSTQRLESFMNIYHSFLPQPLGTRPGARPE